MLASHARMRTKPLWTVPLAFALALTTATPALSATVSAEEPSRGQDEGYALINGQYVGDPDLATRLLRAYWTPERMRSAQPVRKPNPPSDPDTEKLDRPGRTGAARSAAEPAKPLTTSFSTAAVNASPGVGKVFFTDKSDGKDYVCSGSTINNPAANMVSTAGHCVHHGKGGHWHENWTYVPYYDHGAAPYGIWAAKWFTSVKGWTKKSYSWWDFAFVNVWTNGGQKLVHRTGGQGLSFNYGKWISVTLLAYPNAAPFDGQWQIYCQGNMYPHGFTQVGFNCLMTGGASGGPFLRAWDNDLRFGYTNSVIAHGPDDKNYGPYFDDDVLDIYNLAKNKS